MNASEALAAKDLGSAAGEQSRFLQTCVLGDSATPAMLLAGDVSVRELDELFQRQPLLRCVVMTGDEGPVVLDRSWFQSWITGPLGYGRALHHRLQLSRLKPPASLILASDTEIDVAATAVLKTQRVAMIDNVGVLWPDGRIDTSATTAVFEMLSRQYAFQALHDMLTGLPNRAYLTRELHRAGNFDQDVVLLYADLDRFKDVNDRFGHATGDQLLVMFAERLRRVVRAGDFVARLGGDEFAVLMTGGISPIQVETVAERIITAAAAPFTLLVDPGSVGNREQLVSVGVSVGLAGSSQTDSHRYSSLDSLLKHADLAMYHAKTLGRGRIFQFDRALLLDNDAARRTQARHHMERRLRVAIHEARLELHYQPLVELVSGRITGAEALARWHDDELGDVPPVEFINVAEESGLIVDLGRWVLYTACREAATWPGVGNDQPPGVAVNVSAVQLAQPSFIDDVVAALAASGLAPNRLCLEITETAAISELDETAQRLSQLRDLGVRIALDDFGTGFSSLTMLRDLPVNIVKIDKSFVDRITSDAGDAVLVRLIIDAAHSLGMSLCAEGVEQPQQAHQLMAMGCDTIQGWLVAQALPGSSSFTAWLASHACAPFPI